MKMEYKPLDQAHNEIRLLTIVPLEDGSRNEIEPVECILEYVAGRKRVSYSELQSYRQEIRDFHLDLEQAQAISDAAILSSARSDADGGSDWGDFAALSYAWGDPTDTRMIYVNGHRMFVTKNLEAALRQLRVIQFVTLANGKPFFSLWVDAICINQSDLNERSQQVQRMRLIYAKARIVVAWLGEAEDESEKAMKYIKAVGEKFDLPQPMYQTMYLPAETGPGSAEYLGEGIARAICELFCRPYWQRLWVVQELAVGEVVVMCGQEYASWRHFMIAARRLTQYAWYEFISLLNYEVVHHRYEVKPNPMRASNLIDECYLQVLRYGAVPDILHIVETGRTLQTTDPRDKVYGLLGLMKPTLSAAIVPNYSSDSENVLLAFAVAAIKEERNLELLRAVDVVTSSSLLPSWVPILHRKPRAFCIGYTFMPAPVFCCSGAMKPVMTILQHIHLQVKGILLDTIHGLGAVHEFDRREYDDPSLNLSIMKSGNSRNPYGDVEAIRRALWQTLLAGADRLQDGTPIDIGKVKLATDYRNVMRRPNYYDGDSEVVYFIKQFLYANQGLEICGMELVSLLCTAQASGLIDTSLVEQVISIVYQSISGRRVVITRNGYIGIGRSYTRHGDIIAIVPGCSVPLALRRLGDGFIVIGDCYIHGIMNGEAVADSQKANSMLESLTLV
jgi:hypothetical protein